MYLITCILLLHISIQEQSTTTPQSWKETLQYDDIWWRYECAKSRGAIHSHAVVSSTRHADKIKEALDGENSADQLWKWLQTTELDSPEDNVYSPGFVSMHPAGGIESTSIDGQKEWVPNKSSWSWKIKKILFFIRIYICTDVSYIIFQEITWKMFHNF